MLKKSNNFRIFENRKNELLCLLLGYLITLTSFDLVKVLGVFFIQLQHNFNASASEVSFTIGLSSAMVFLGGPFYGAVLNKFGIRITFAISGLLMFLGFSANFFAFSLLYVRLSMGLVAGLGAGLSNVAILTLMGRAFHTNRPIANAATSMGGSTATALGGPVVQLCISLFTWHGALLLLGAFCLNVIVFGFLVAPRYQAIMDKRRRASVIKTTDKKKQTGNERRIEMVHKSDDRLIPLVVENDSTLDTENLQNPEDNIIKEYSVSKNSSRTSARRQSRRKSIAALTFSVESLFDISLLRDPFFICYCMSCGFSVCARMLSGLYMVRYAQSLGIGDSQSAEMLSVCEIASCVTAVLLAMLTSVKRKPDNGKHGIRYCLVRVLTAVRRSYILGIFQLAMTCVILFPTVVKGTTAFVAYAAMLGICYGAVSPMVNVVLADMFGTEKLAGALGYRSLASGTLILSLPPLIGHLIDKDDNYEIAQYATSILSCLSGLLTIFTQIALLRRERGAAVPT